VRDTRLCDWSRVHYEIGSCSVRRGSPFAHIDWAGAEKQLEGLANASGGRAYELESTLAVSGIYDDIMENLRLRYVVTYVSSNPAISGPLRNIRVELIDPTTGKALKIRDSAGKIIYCERFHSANL